MARFTMRVNFVHRFVALWCLTVTAVSAANVLLPNTAPEGFTSLFNGRDLTGWRGLIEVPAREKMSPEKEARAQAKADVLMRKNWVVRNGSIIYTGRGFDNLTTISNYGDFELLIDWMIPGKSDSGLYLRGMPQVQIWAEPVGSGGLFNNKKHPDKPLKRADKPVGQWNTFRILMRGSNVTVFLNGECVVNDVPMENYWDRKKPAFALGPIELQAHRDPVYFRNIYIRELSPVRHEQR